MSFIAGLVGGALGWSFAAVVATSVTLSVCFGIGYAFGKRERQ